MNAANGIISQPSPYSVTATIDRLAAILQANLPMQALAWSAVDGKVWLSYNAIQIT